MATTPRPIRFSTVDYWKLRALDGDIQTAQLAVALTHVRASVGALPGDQAQAILLELSAKQQAATATRATHWNTVCVRYRLDPNAMYRADDATTSLTLAPAPTHRGAKAKATKKR